MLSQYKPLSFVKNHWLILTYILLVGGILTFVPPPFQKPDEEFHYLRAVALSRGEAFCHQGNPPYFNVNQSAMDLVSQLQAKKIHAQNKEKFPINWYFRPYPYNSQATKFENYCALSPVGYVPFALTISVGKLFNNELINLYLARITALIIFLIIALIAYRHTPKRYQILSLFVICLPMTLYQASSVNYDYIQIGLGLLIFSSVMTMIHSRKVTLKTWLLLLTYITLINIIKPSHYAFILLTLPFAFKLHKLKPKLLPMLVGALTVNCLIIFGFNFLIQKGYQSINFVNIADPPRQVQLIIHQPLKFTLVLLNSLARDANRYYKSLIGLFGWFELEMNFFLYLASFLILSIIIFDQSRKIARFPSDLIRLRRYFWLFLLVICLNLGFNILVMYIISTPYAFPVIVGFQGRYLLPLLPFILLCSAIVLDYILKSPRIYKFILLVLIICTAISLLYSFWHRYYHYSALYLKPYQEAIITGDPQTPQLKPQTN